MKQFKWPRPPLILGVVLGDTIERYMFISVERYGLSWMLRPVVAILFAHGDHRAGAAVPAGHPPAQAALRQMLAQLPGADIPSLATVHDVHDRADRRALVVFALRWDFSAKIVPLVVGTVGADGGRCQPVQRHVPQARRAPAPAGLAEQAQHEVGADSKIHMDLTSDTAHLPVREIVRRADPVLRLPDRLHGA